MISVSEAKRMLSKYSEKGEKITVDLQDSLGYILAQDISSPIDVPSFNNSAMDGYAMQFDEQRNEWEVNSIIQAGDTSEITVPKGKAARIFTGAKMPEGADTVIPQELIQKEESGNLIKYKDTKIKSGSNVRLKGSQCKKGDFILQEGVNITPGVIGLLASVGFSEIKIFTPPKVAYIITGDELKEPGQSLKEGEIYNSNGPMLEACLKQTGIKEISALKASDDKEKLQKIINKALAEEDILILSGGISVGDYDFVKECLQDAGVKELFYKIKQRPGKPMFAGKKGKKWIFALPGNPASVLSCFYQYVKPCLEFQMGKQEAWKPDAILNLKENFKKKPGLTFFLKGKKEDENVKILGAQQSFNLQAFSTANCLVELEEDKEFIEAGTAVNVYDL